MTADERLLSAQKQIWSSQIHNLRSQILGIRDRINKTPEPLKAPMFNIVYSLGEAQKHLNDAEFQLDTEMRDAMRHMAEREPDKCPA